MRKSKNMYPSDLSYSASNPNVSESFRILRTNLQFSMASDDSSVILVTSSFQGEGKSWNAANIACVFADQGKNTLLIDADLRRGVQEKRFGVSNSNGLSNYLANVNCNEKNFIKNTSVANLSIITRGNVPPNPSELLSSERMEELISRVKEEFDIVIIDMPPVLVVTDALILANKVDKVILVGAMNQTRTNAILEAKKALDNVGAKICGVILNKDKNKARSYYKYGGKYGKGYGYGYGYGY